jgi:hypothetical protein
MLGLPELREEMAERKGKKEEGWCGVSVEGR